MHHYAGAKDFSKLDAKAGYWSVQLDTESQLLTTFQSPFGSDKGVHPDHGKINDLQAMPAPTGKKELQEFLGFVTYLSPFIANLADKSSPLRGLLKEDVPFQWEDHDQQCFDKLKEVRFHTYLYGRRFKVLTEPKPLVMILQKPPRSAPPRLQQIRLKLQDYQLDIEYRPGREMTLPDTLSRLPNAENDELDVRVDLVRFSTDRIQALQNATATRSSEDVPRPYST
ncbi:PREDICTED: uncharacterized protein LOC106813825 [Priapulus caudatus]|uniref:Uncharacterized protein LOC106813825 n=1 Tax=Priapulus caudatus TaxID=37621 RepID=A0ABM1EMX0_PRICU|nr:PREDICTED: uncharacterized protein LOC106813825 [Priapulus caudatus]